MARTSTISVTVQWGDCDPAAIVFYPKYFYWFDSAAHALFDRLLAPKTELLQRFSIIGFPLAEASARFLRPSRVGQAIEIESEVVSCTERRFTVAHRCTRNGELLIEGQEMRFVGQVDPGDPQRLRAIALPAELVLAFGLTDRTPS
jgi:4-hydroxybenzoyl-CoA thioesterase